MAATNPQSASVEQDAGQACLGAAVDGLPAGAIEAKRKTFVSDDLGPIPDAARRYDAAVSSLRQEGTYRTVSRRILAASLAQLGRTDDARQEAALFMAANPSFTIAAWAAHEPSRDQATLDHLVEGYRMAGLPD